MTCPIRCNQAAVAVFDVARRIAERFQSDAIGMASAVINS
jgi:hypothetical protein